MLPLWCRNPAIFRIQSQHHSRHPHQPWFRREVERGHVGEIFDLAKCDDFKVQWRHNDHDGVSNHQPRGCLLNRLFRRRSKKTSKLRVAGICAENSPGPVKSPHKGPATRKTFLFDNVIMIHANLYPQQNGQETHQDKKRSKIILQLVIKISFGIILLMAKSTRCNFLAA